MRNHFSFQYHPLSIAAVGVLTCLLGSTPATARQYTVSQSTGLALCKGRVESANGVSGCGFSGKNGNLYEVGCKAGSSKCTIVVIIKPTGGSKTGKGSIRTGGIKASAGTTSEPIAHPVQVGTGMKSIVNGNSNSGGHHR